MAAWGNALGGFRRQKRDYRGRFSSSGAAARKTYKAAKAQNRRGHQARVKGSVKARGKELRNPAVARTRNVVGGASMYAIGTSIGSNNLKSRGYSKAKYGVQASYGRTTATRKMSKGLQKSRNKTAKRQYQKEIGSTRTTRAVRNGIVAATAVGLAYGAYKSERTFGQKSGDAVQFGIKGNAGSGAKLLVELGPGRTKGNYYAKAFTPKNVRGSSFGKSGVWTYKNGVYKKRR